MIGQVLKVVFLVVGGALVGSSGPYTPAQELIGGLSGAVLGLLLSSPERLDRALVRARQTRAIGPLVDGLLAAAVFGAAMISLRVLDNAWLCLMLAWLLGAHASGWPRPSAAQEGACSSPGRGREGL